MLNIFVQFVRLSSYESIRSCQAHKWCVSSITSYRQVYVLNGPVCKIYCISLMDDLFCVLPFNKTLIRSPIRTLEAAHLLGTQMKKIQLKVHGSKHGSRDVLMIHFEKRSEVLLSEVHKTNHPAFKGAKQFFIRLSR